MNKGNEGGYFLTLINYVYDATEINVRTLDIIRGKNRLPYIVPLLFMRSVLEIVVNYLERGERP